MRKSIYELTSEYNYLMNERFEVMNRLDYWVGSEKEETAMYDRISELNEKIYMVNIKINLYHRLKNKNITLVKN